MILKRGQLIHHIEDGRKSLVRLLRMHTFDPGMEPTAGPIDASEVAMAEAEIYRKGMQDLGSMEDDRPVFRVCIADPEGCLEEATPRSALRSL